MKTFFVPLFFLITFSINNLFAQQYPSDATLYIIDEATQGTNINPIILQKLNPVPVNSIDLRVHPTTNTTQSEMSIAVHPLNNQIILASANASNYPVTTIYGTGYYISTDGGITWAGNDQPPSGAGNKGDPATVIDRNGYMYIGSISSTSGQGIMRSTNNGTTWNYYTVANTSSQTLDKNHLAVDNTQSIYSGYLYSAWSDFNLSDRGITVARSTNSGQNWVSHQVISTGFASGYAHQGVNLQVGPNGVVYACWAVRSASSPFGEVGIGFNKSTNGGQTWGTPTYAINNIKGMRLNPYPVLGIRTNSFPVMGVNIQTGRIYIAWVNIGVPGTNTGDPDAYLIYSDNGGTSWSTPKRVNNDQLNNNAIQFHCWMSVDPITGDVYVAFYDNRSNIGTNICEFYVSKSSDNGQSFENFPVSDNSFSVGPLPGFLGNYSGEYPGIAANNGNVYPLWHSQVPSANAQGWTSPMNNPNISIIVDQKLSTTTSVDSIGLWDFSQNKFDKYSVPKAFTWNTYGTKTLQGSQKIISNQKYNIWLNEQDVINHHSFIIEPSTSQLTSQFNPTNSGITIKNSLEGTGLDGGQVHFKDPWLIDYPDPQYGNTLRNQGMDAPFKNRTSPFYPSFTSNYGGDIYQGIFLNQPYTGNNPVYYSLKADAYQDIPVSQTGKTHRFYFHKWTGANANFQYPISTETGVVFTDGNSTVQANLKGTQLSNNIEAYSSSSQNKFVRTENGNLHNVYVSMGALWYERSTNGGATWEIANYGRALNTDNPKGVSIDYLPPSSGDDIITIAYQCTTSTGSKVVVDVFKNGQPRTPVYYRYTVIDFSHSQNDYDEMNAEPVVSVSSGWDVMVVYKVPALLPLEGNPVTTSALYYSLGWLNGLVGWELTWYSPNNKWVIIPTTNYNSIQPAIAEDVYSTSNPTNYFHIAYQENNQIKYYYKFGQVRTGSLSQNSNPICISCNNGFSQNYSPSIIPAGQTARVCWVGYRLVTQEGEYEVEAVPQYKVLFKDPFNTSRYWQFGNDVSAPSFNKSPNFYAFGWREASNQNKFADNNLSTVRTLNTSGQELQICNGTASSNMYAMSYNRNDGLPYYFLMSNNLGSFYSLAKTTAISFSSGREGIVAVDNAEFYFALGDINIDGQTVDFEEISDTVSISDIVSLNQNLISKPMNITDNSSFVYSVQYGINDSLSVAQSLVDQRTVNFKVMLIDNTTGETIGVYDDITYNSSNLYQYNSISYQVNTAGIGNRTIRLKLVLNNNFDANYSLSKIYSNESVLAKANHKQIEFDCGGVVKEYALAQNYPNPFNPSTTIRYQIPQDGIVTLKIYDVLGAEVATLVNEQKAAGKYEVNFSATGGASALASGVYIYKIQAGDFTNSKKMILLK